MRNRIMCKLIAGWALAACAATSLATPIVWDYSPAGTGATVRSDNWTNQLPGQHFAERVTFASTTLVGGMDIYSDNAFGALNDQVQITIWSNSGAEPGSIMAAFISTVSAVDGVGAYNGQHRLHANFSAFAMLADTIYWIGMAPTSASWTQTGLNNVAGGNGRSAQFSAGNYLAETSVGDMAFRLLAPEAVQVPEPGTVALFAMAWMGFAAAKRRAR